MPDRSSRHSAVGPPRRWLPVLAGAAVSLALAACGSAAGGGKTPTATGGSTSAASATATMWLVTNGPSPANTAVENLIASFEKTHPGEKISLTWVENQAFKQKIQLAMGAGNPPTMFWSWGGGTLQQFIKASDVVSLGASPAWASAFLPASLGAITYQGQLYGAPITGTQPVHFFYNKQVFAKYHLAFPTSWSGLLSTISTLKTHGVTPISLANGDQWPGLMYLEYLTDRIGGPSVAQALQSNTPGAWSNPAITAALTDIQDLVKAGAFQSGYDSLHYSGGSDALVFSGKAAMQLMGDWDISSILGADASFVNSGNLGMSAFPVVEGGKGDPADLAGNAASYVAISSKATAAQQKIAEDFFKDELTTTSYAKAEVGAGEVPVTNGAAPLFSGQALASYDTTIYNSVLKAPSFQYSWDQALTPTVATAMLTNLAQVFELTETPAKFASLMNAAAASS